MVFNCLCLSMSHAEGLSGGDQFTTQRIEGQLTVSCMSGTPGPTNGSTYCRDEILNPGEYSYFIGSTINADHVSLQATREDGTVSKLKTVEYDSVSGKSKKSFNLWINTVFQRPLLGFGKNTVTFNLIKNGVTVKTGSFIVQVSEGEHTVCQRTGYYTSMNSADCQNPQIFCSRYFSENNYCQ